ncbi:homeodomain-interacting protein kinase 2-like isoform X2 [Siniperca chuatsi]|uniref:homeodomain-interacting protein kinase 2-like isoform X2 n=1 Tax=Siniperca chuatsi TaxID=119488 RepID=UPI001CE11B79|nr:homeodomain-interacting protein kinase 2-like isoform X2 [Siniperca chuatsi]
MAEDSSSDSDVYPIPSDYELIDFVGSGDYGTVAKCKNRDTGEPVAIKASILQELMRQNLDQYNIVKFYDWYQMNNRTGLVLELLDMNLLDYMKEDRLPLKDIRVIIQQLATAFNALRSVGVIHGDLKPDNIMLVKDQEQSFTVKLIDFGLAFHSSEAVVGSSHQLPYYRAPEIMLGLTFTEAIDMWSLGIVMGFMMLGALIFPWFCDYNQMKSICEILGQPADHLLDAGLKTEEFFIKTSDNQWTLISHDQYWKHKISSGNKKFAFSSLDDLKMLSEELESEAEAEGWRQCIELLKEMLRVDASERITPSEVLRHPFITQSYLNEALQPAADELSSSQAWTNFRTETATKADDSTQAGQAQDTQGARNTTLECLSDMLSCATLMLDPDPAAAPGIAQDTVEIQTELEDTTSDDSEPHEARKKKKTKKNCIRRFFSWMKRTFNCPQ